MRLSTAIIFGMISLAAFSGCALAPPSSEALIFRDHESNNYSHPVIPPPNYNRSAGIQSFFKPQRGLSFAITARPYVSEELNYAKDQFAPFIQKTLADDSTLSEKNLVIQNPNYLSISVPITLIQQKNIRWALSVGVPVVGTDVTAKFDQTYVTANLGFGEGEVIVQQKLTQTKASGLALGGYFRTERRNFEITNDKKSLVILVPIADALSPDRVFYNHILGGRLNGYLNLPSGSFLQLRVATGYALNLNQPVLNFGLSINLN